MECVERGDLFTEWDKQNGFTEELIKIYAIEVGLALDFLHQKRIIHRCVIFVNVFNAIIYYNRINVLFKLTFFLFLEI